VVGVVVIVAVTVVAWLVAVAGVAVVSFPVVIAADALVRLSDASSFRILRGGEAGGEWSDPGAEACCAFNRGKNRELQKRNDDGDGGGDADGDGREEGAGGPAFVISPRSPAAANIGCDVSLVCEGAVVFFFNFKAAGVADGCCRTA